MSSDIGRRASNGSLALFAARLVGRIADTLLLIVLARVLEPVQFGVAALATAIVGLIEVFRDLGLEQAAINGRTYGRRQLSTVFWLATGVAIPITMAVALSAKPLANAMGSPASSELIVVMAFIIPLNAAALAPGVSLRRDLDFKRFSGATAIAGVVAAGGAAIIAAIDPSPWAIVLKAVINSALLTALLFAFSRVLPRFAFDRKYAGGLLRFGSAVAVTRVMEAASNQGDDLLVSRFYGPASLGLYSIAFRLFRILSQTFTGTVAQVSGPVLVRLRESRARLLQGYYRAISLTSFVGMPVFAALAFASDWLIPLLFGAGWEGAVPVARVLSIVGVVACVRYFDAQLLYVLGRPGLALILRSIGVSLTLICFTVAGLANLPLISFAVIHAGVAVLISAPLWILTLRKVAGVSPMKTLTASLGPFSGCCALLLVASLSNCVLSVALSQEFAGTLSVGLGMICYLIVCRKYAPEAYGFTFDLLKDNRLRVFGFASRLQPLLRLKGRK